MPDALGSVRLVMTSTGSATFSAGYEPYGEEYETSGSTLMTYAGAVYDQATGLYLMGARYYSPQLQRFITADSYSGDVDVPLSLNRYAYVGDDPATYTDPSGHSLWNSWSDFVSVMEGVGMTASTEDVEALGDATGDIDSGLSKLGHAAMSDVGVLDLMFSESSESVSSRVPGLLASATGSSFGVRWNIGGTIETVLGITDIATGMAMSEAGVVLRLPPLYYMGVGLTSEGILELTGVTSCIEHPTCAPVVVDA